MTDSYTHQGEERFDEESGGMVFFTTCGKRIPYSPGSTAGSDDNLPDWCPECVKAKEVEDGD